MSIHICLMTLLIAGSPDSSGSSSLPQGWTIQWSCLADAYGAGTWSVDHPEIDSTTMDAALSITAKSPEVDFLACGSITRDSTEQLGFRRGRAVVQWPGTPWIGAGVFLSDIQPFIPGLSNPIVEWGWQEIDSLYGYGISCGGILGFDGEYLLQRTSSDTVSQLNIQSPWMGFAGISYSRAQFHPSDTLSGSGLVINSLTIRSNFRYVKPWVVIAGGEGEPGRWAVTGQIRGFKPLRTSLGDIEVVPGIAFAGSNFLSPGSAFVPGQRQLSLSAWLKSTRYVASGCISGVLDLDSDSLSGASVSGMLVSESGIRWETEGSLTGEGDYMIMLGAGTFRGGGGAELNLTMVDDSTRIEGSAFVSPRGDVTAGLTVSADVDGTLDPRCRLDIATFLGPVSGHFGILWDEDEDVSLVMNLRGFFQ